ncbi:MAG: asparagine synthase-related protein [Desulforhopalus sp.]|nr:asparagine synthase-related protein [Desulforhopalus sp.]
MTVISGFIPGRIALCPNTVNLSLLKSFPLPNHLDCRIWTNSVGVGLGYRELPTNQQSLLGLQSFSQQAPFTIVADARLDNRDEVLCELGLSCPRSCQDSITDSLIILKSYIKWGENCAKHLLGDFAFAVWNDQTKELFAARDHLGIRPFYYHNSDNFFAFCSNIKGLLKLPHVWGKLHEHAIADYLIGNYEDIETTIHPHIKRLPPANSLIFSKNKLSLQRYWKLERQKPLILSCDEDYALALREQITQAISCRLRTVFPVGVMLSGGLDSSALAAITNDTLRKKNIPFSTYSYVLPAISKEEEIDERKFIDLLLKKTGNVHYHITAPAQSPFQRCDEYFNILCEPLHDSFYFIQESIYKEASLNKVRVLLTGIGGDMTASFAGTNCLAYLASQFRLKELYSSLKLRQRVTGDSFASLFLRQVLLKFLPDFFPSAFNFIFRKNSTPKVQYAFSRSLCMSSDIYKRLNILKEQRNIQKALDHQLVIQHAVTYAISSFMEHRATTAASFGLSVCHPFLDIRIVKFCMSLPQEQFFKDGWHRSIFRRAMKGIIPVEIAFRPGKKPFIPDYMQRILRDKVFIEELLTKENSSIARYLDKAKIFDYLNYICSSVEKTAWHPNILTLLGDAISMASFLQWFDKIDSKDYSGNEF